jgi:hypothetical protein
MIEELEQKSQLFEQQPQKVTQMSQEISAIAQSLDQRVRDADSVSQRACAPPTKASGLRSLLCREGSKNARCPSHWSHWSRDKRASFRFCFFGLFLCFIKPFPMDHFLTRKEANTEKTCPSVRFYPTMATVPIEVASVRA